MAIAERALQDGESLIAELPVELAKESGNRRIGCVLVSNRRIQFLHRVDGSWNKFTDYSLSSEPFAHHSDNEVHAVFIPEPDASRVEKLHSKYVSEMEARTGAAYFTEFLDTEGSQPDVEPANCSCQRLSSNEVLVESENLELGNHFDEEEFRFVSCKHCFKIYGRYREGKKASVSKLCSADWLLGGDTSSDSIIELGEEDAFAIHHPPDGSTRLQDAVLTISHIPSRSDEVASTYKHEYQHAFCYIQNGELKGYLTWEDHDTGAVLSQIYVRDEHRGNGIASTLVSEWYNQVCKSNRYYADELTDGGRAVLNGAGHLDGNPTPVREVLSLSPMAFG